METEQKPVTREELAEALGRAYRMHFGIENWSKSVKDEEWAKIAMLWHRLDAETKARALLSRLDAEREGGGQ